MAKPVSMDEKLLADMAEALRDVQYGILHQNIRQSMKDKIRDALRSYEARQNSKRFHGDRFRNTANFNGNPHPTEPKSITITLPVGVDVVTVTMESNGNLLVMDEAQAQLLGACPSSSFHHSWCVK